MPLALAFMAVCTAPSSASEWIYRIFVQKCEEAGGTPLSTFEAFERGEEFQCDQGGASGASRAGEEPACASEARESVDWVFRDDGARATFRRFRDQGFADFEAVVGAQGHNPHAQRVLRQCRPFVVSYLATRGLNDEGRSISRIDCGCVSVVATGQSDGSGRPLFRVSNSCERLDLTVRFATDILSQSVRNAFPTPTTVRGLQPGADRLISAPDRRYVSIDGFSIGSAGRTVECPM